MTPDQMALLERVNLEVNALPYEAFATIPEPPDWYSDTPIPGHSWVCRCFAQRKASLLKDARWPDPAHLVERLCLTETGEPHGVLQVSDPGNPDDDLYILDSRFPYIYRASAPPPGYRWTAEQIPGTWPIQWRRL